MPRGDEDEIVARCDPLLFFGAFLATPVFFESLT